MKKTKSLFLALLASAFLLGGCHSDDDSSSGSTSGNNSTSQSQGNTLEQIVQAFSAQLDAPNVSLDMTVHTTRVFDKAYHFRTEQSLKFDYNKIYGQITQYDLDAEPVVGHTSEQYYEFGETSYEYTKSDGKWSKTIVPYMNKKPSSQIYGYSQFINSLISNCTLRSDGYFAESFTTTVSSREILTAFEKNPDEYNINVESIEIPYSNVLIGIENGVAKFLQLESYAIGIQYGKAKEGEEKGTAEIRLITDAPSTMKIHNIHDVGTTVVTLPTVDA